MLVLLGVGILFTTQSLFAQSGLDLNNYCSSKDWGRAILVGNTAYDWKCEDSSGRLHDMDLNEACRMQYGSSYRASYSNFNDANSWYCSGGNNSQSNNGSNNGNGNSGQSSPPVSNSDNGGSISSSQQSDCYAHAEPVSVGGRGQVTPGLSNRIRSGAGLDFEQVGTARPGTAFDVLSGPTCADGYWWWQIRYQGITGWTVEGTNGDNWIEAVSQFQSVQRCSVSIRAYRDSSRGGEIIEIPLDPLPQSFTLYFEGREVPDSDWGVRHNGFAGESSGGNTYLGVGKRWIANLTGRNLNWDDDSLWFISYPC